MKNRLKVFHAETEVLKDYFAEQNRLKVIDGNQPIDAVTAQIFEELGVEV